MIFVYDLINKQLKYKVMTTTAINLISEFDQKQISKCNFIIEKANAEIENIEFQIEQLQKQLKEQKRLIKKSNEEIKWRSL